jgi:aminoglycoside N3'-acetyltransferase
MVISGEVRPSNFIRAGKLTELAHQFRRNNVGSNAFLLIRHTGMSIG